MHSNLAIVILAAGSSSRLGKPKQLLVFQEETLIKRVVKTALAIQLENVFVISGFLKEQLDKELENLPVKVIHNPNWQQGMGSSIQTAVKCLTQNREIQALLFLLSDQPLINTEHLHQLITKFYSDKNSMITATSYAAIKGVPAIFGKSLFKDLENLPAGKGAQWLFNKYPQQTSAVTFNNAAIDIDTHEDYEKLLRLNLK